MNRITRDLTESERARLEWQRKQIAEELPSLTVRDRGRRDAALERSLSGAVRRLIHGSGQDIDQLARKIGVDPLALDEFMTGERPLGSDVLDRIAEEFHCESSFVRVS